MRRFLATLLLILPVASLHAQTTTVPILMLSDIHFDPSPGPNPTLIKTLLATDPTAWATVLGGAGSDQCPITLTTPPVVAAYTDTSYPLFIASLCAEKKYFEDKNETPLFITVSGDLTRHNVDALVSSADYDKFATGIVSFVSYELHAAFPKSPVYFAMGNNDSGCHDYWENKTSDYLTAGSLSFASAVLSKADQAAIKGDFPTMGRYVVNLPAPVQSTRLIVLQDIYEAPATKYAACPGGTAPKPGEEVDWLKDQLDHARTAGDHVWVMAHIPPGIDGFSSSKKDKSCPRVKDLKPFQSSEAMGDLLNANADILSLVLLAHTHMDEMRLFSTGKAYAPGRLTPSITPYDGNTPSFTVGKLDPTNATLIDYTVYSFNDDTANNWYKEYKYSEAYNEKDFSGPTLKKLADSFIKDTSGSNAASLAYQGWYSVIPGVSGGTPLPTGGRISRYWSYFACSVSQLDATAYTNCVCTMDQASAKATAK